MKKQKVLTHLLILAFVLTNILGGLRIAHADATPVSIVVQAEASTSLQDVAIVASAQGATTDFLDYGTIIGGYAEWNNINVPIAGAYHLVFTYQNGSAANRPCDLFVNGSKVGTYGFGLTVDWTTWLTESMNVNFTAGVNTIRIVQTTGAGPNIDKFEITNQAPVITPTSAATITPSSSPSTSGNPSATQTPTPSTTFTPAPTPVGLLAYDGFNGNLGGLVDQTSGSGFKNIYDYEGTRTDTGNKYIVGKENPFKYQNLAVTPQYLYTQGSNGRTGRGFDYAGIFNREGLTDGDLIGKNGTDIWMSFLIKSQLNGTTGIVLSEGSGFWHNNSEKIGVGVFGNNSIKDGKKYWSLKVADTYNATANEKYTGPVLLSNKQAKPGETVFFVMKMSFGDTNTIKLYINPDLSQPLPEQADLEKTSNVSLKFRGFTIHSGDAIGMDEIRLGKSFHSVTPLSDYKIPITKIKVVPANGNASTLAGGRFEGSNLNETNGFEEVVSIPQNPTGSSIELDITAAKAYRYVKYYGAVGSNGKIAEIEYYSNGRKLTGKPFGTVAMEGNEPDKAFDGNAATFYQGQLPDNQYVGLDLGGATTASKPYANPISGRYESPLDVILTSETEGADIYYTLDGTMPSNISSTKYTTPIHVGLKNTAIIKAIAYKAGMPESEMAAFSYGVGVDAPVISGLRTYHLGNSLTDTLNSWVKKAADSAGFNHNYMRYTIPGTPTDNIWTTFYDEPNGDTPKQNNLTVAGDIFPWIDMNGSLSVEQFAPVDVLTTQPYSQHGRNLENETKYASKFYDQTLRFSPNARFIVYGQWSNWKFDANNLSENDSYALGKQQGVTFPYAKPANWEEAIKNQYAMHEAIAAKLNEKYPNKQHIDVIPSGIALVNVKKAIESGELTGFADFPSFGWNDVNKDSGHLSERGAYVVSLTAIAVMYKQSPYNKVTAYPSSLTEAQAKKIQQIVWETCRTYKYSGVYGLSDTTPTPTASPTSSTTATPTMSASTTPTVSPTSTPTATPDTQVPSKPMVDSVGDNNANVTGKAEAGSTVEVKNKSTILGTSITTQSGNFSVRIKIQKAGTKLTLTATDKAGNKSDATTVTVKDKTPPKMPYVKPITSKSKTVTGKAEAYAMVTVKKGRTIIGNARTNSKGVYSVRIKTQPRGTTLYVTAKDKAGNSSKPVKVKVK